MNEPAEFHLRIENPNGILTTNTPVTAEQAEQLVLQWTTQLANQYPAIGTETLTWPEPGWLRRTWRRLSDTRTFFRFQVCLVLYHYATDAITRVPGDFFDWFHVLTAMWVAPTVAVLAWKYSE